MDLEKYIETLTDKEKKEHKDLIKECRLRDKWLKKNKGKASRNLTVLCDSIEKLINPDVVIKKENLKNGLLKSIKDEHFFKA